MSPSTSIANSSRQDSSATLHETMHAPDASSIGPASRPALSRGDTGSTRVESLDDEAIACTCGAPKARKPTDEEAAQTACTQHCTKDASQNEKLQITDEERRKAPPFCEMQKVLSAKNEELIYVGWNGPDDPANPRNWSFKKKWIITAVSPASGSSSHA